MVNFDCDFHRNLDIFLNDQSIKVCLNPYAPFLFQKLIKFESA